MKNAEDIEVDFENKSGIKFRLKYSEVFLKWFIVKIFDNGAVMEIGQWETITEAEACAKALKESV